MKNWLSLLTNWFFGLFQKAFTALTSFIHDFALWVAFQITDAIATAIVAIPMPQFLLNGLDITALYSGMPGMVLYIMGQMHLAAAISIISAGIAFNLLRKLFTLGQW